MLPSNTGRILKRIQDTLEELRKIELSQTQSYKTNRFSFVVCLLFTILFHMYI